MKNKRGVMRLSNSAAPHQRIQPVHPDTLQESQGVESQGGRESEGGESGGRAEHVSCSAVRFGAKRMRSGMGGRKCNCELILTENRTVLPGRYTRAQYRMVIVTDSVAV
jgi:hypothetical protein